MDVPVVALVEEGYNAFSSLVAATQCEDALFGFLFMVGR